MGWSMVGYGVLRAVELHPQRLGAVCGVSADLWRSYADGVGDAFESADDDAATTWARRQPAARGAGADRRAE